MPSSTRLANQDRVEQVEESKAQRRAARPRSAPPEARARAWWRSAVVYEVYLRSFADSDGDGVGDIGGLRGRLPYLADLGVDAVWITPWYPSPMADGGYDVSDYCDIDPRFGTLADADALLADAHALGLRVIVDLVANHTSERAPVVRRRARRGPGSPERDRYFFRDGRAGGERAAQRLDQRLRRPARGRACGSPTAGRGSGTCTCSPPSSPTSTGAGPAVREDFDAVLRFWLDRGVDGLRVDAAPAMAKVPGLPDAGHAPGARFESRTWVDNPHWDVDSVHDILRRWRAHRGHLRRRPAVRHRGRRPRSRTAQPLRAPGRDAHQLQLRLPHRAVGGAPAARRSSTRASPRSSRSARRPPGCCPATTRPGT